MSGEALAQFEQARKDQLDRNEARRMRTLVNQARGDTHGAGARWPFELTQNAHDPGARAGADGVNLWLSFDGETVVFEHDGKPFTMQDLAALLSGGSSKEFESTETTGRFGTGFLVTHVLSLQIEFEGLLAAGTGHEQVSIRLDRSGDEHGIFENTTHCYQGIRDAKVIETLDGQRTARFAYATDNPEAAQIGLSTFSATLPYLYGTCEHLGTVSITSDGVQTTLVPQTATEPCVDGTHVWERCIEVHSEGHLDRTMRVVRLRRAPDSPSSLVLVLEKVGDRWKVCVPAEDAPRLYSRFPIRASDFVPINAVIDGRFDLRQERDRVLMKESDKEQISQSLGLLPTLVHLAIEERWIDGHRLARVGMPLLAFGEKMDDALQAWWRGQLHDVATLLANLPLVETAAGFLCPGDGSSAAVFAVPCFDLRQNTDELPHQDVWQLVSDIDDANPPLLPISGDWTKIVAEWTGVGVNVRRVSLTQASEIVRDEATTLEQLRVGDPIGWLCRFLSALGRIADKHNCATILDRLIPDQNNTLKSPRDLLRDEGIDETLKDIATAIDIDVRGRLVLDELIRRSDDGELSSMESLLKDQVDKSLGEEAVIAECLEALDTALPDNKAIPPERQIFRESGLDLLRFLWTSRKIDAATTARKCPLVVSDDTAARCAGNRKAMAPVAVWHADAKPFAALYKEDRVLSDEYLTYFDGDTVLIDALVAWGMAFRDPLCRDTPRELKDDRLKAMAVEGVDCDGVTVTEVDLTQIALLPNELIQRCQSDESVARLLLGMVLKHTAPHDPSWRDAVEIPGRKDRADIKVTVRPALWLADLKTKAWVPVEGEDGVEPVRANAGNLGPILDPTWLCENDAAVEFLSRHFGFSPLELRLLSTVPSDEMRGQVEDGLASIVQALGGDPTKYAALAEDLVARQQREAGKQRNRQFGLGVQSAIERCMDARGLHPDLVDCGYDYDLFLDDESLIDAGTHHLRVADYFLEVKATTTGEVRLTPAQARKASVEQEKFILCVVDLRGLSPDEMASEWSVEDVEPNAKIVPGIGALVLEPHRLVDEAKDCEVGIRNDGALRYGVPLSIWESGVSIADWVLSLELPEASTECTGPDDGQPPS